MSVKAMNQLPPVQESRQTRDDKIFKFVPLSKNRRALLYCIAAVFVYLFIGTLTYSLWIPEWNVVDALYFSVATLTTVGYGDLGPMDDGQRAFTIFFVVLGATLLIGILFGYLFDNLYDSFQNISKESKSRVSNYFIDRLDNGGPEGLVLDDEVRFWPELCTSAGKGTPLVVALVVPPLIMGYYENWNVLSSFYFTVVTSTTIGYGDIAPQNTWMRLIAAFYLPVCIFVMAKFIARLTVVYLRHKARSGEYEYYHRQISENDIELMDIEGDSNVGYDEFMVFMLVAMGKVTPEDIQSLEELYQRIDADNDGAIKLEDLFAIAYGETKDV